MVYHQTIFANGEYYHVFNRGVEKRRTFLTKRDFYRFTNTLAYYLNPKNTARYSFKDRTIFKKNVLQKPQPVSLLCYVLMPNHFHLLIKQITEKGITNFLSKIANSYTKYFNTKNKRVGPLFQGTFKAVRIEDQDQLLHVSRYIHLNPLGDYLVKDLDSYYYSSFLEYSGKTTDGICKTVEILSNFKSNQEYRSFVLGQEKLNKEFTKIDGLTLDK